MSSPGVPWCHQGPRILFPFASSFSLCSLIPYPCCGMLSSQLLLKLTICFLQARARRKREKEDSRRFLRLFHQLKMSCCYPTCKQVWKSILAGPMNALSRIVSLKQEKETNKYLVVYSPCLFQTLTQSMRVREG